jgi:CO dehydrogenase/acetyl-CoA synthase alpha subunit
LRFDDAYVREVDAWVRSVDTGQPTGPSVRDGYAAMVVADACVQSAKTEQRQTVPALERPALYVRQECKTLCPQEIDIPDIMSQFAEVIANMPRLGPPPPLARPAASAG